MKAIAETALREFVDRRKVKRDKLTRTLHRITELRYKMDNRHNETLRIRVADKEQELARVSAELAAAEDVLNGASFEAPPIAELAALRARVAELEQSSEHSDRRAVAAEQYAVRRVRDIRALEAERGAILAKLGEALALAGEMEEHADPQGAAKRLRALEDYHASRSQEPFNEPHDPSSCEANMRNCVECAGNVAIAGIMGQRLQCSKCGKTPSIGAGEPTPWSDMGAPPSAADDRTEPLVSTKAGAFEDLVERLAEPLAGPLGVGAHERNHVRTILASLATMAVEALPGVDDLPTELRTYKHETAVVVLEFVKGCVARVLAAKSAALEQAIKERRRCGWPLENLAVERFARELHEAGREAVARGLVVNNLGKPFLSWDEITEEAREGRRLQARFILERYLVLPFAKPT